MMARARPETRDALAAEYALGTLHGAARRRFETWLAADRDLRRRVVYWERTLAVGAAEEVVPIAPPLSVWRGVRRRLFGGGQWRPRGAWAAAAALLQGPEAASRHSLAAPVDLHGQVPGPSDQHLGPRGSSCRRECARKGGGVVGG